MDSSNSGSFQSSSGGGDNNNDEFDSRTQSISSFFNPNNNNNNNNSSTNFNTSNNINQLLQVQVQVQPPYHHLHTPPTPTDNTFYNPPIQDPANSPWTGTIRSDHPNLPAGFATGYKINPNPNPNPSMDNSQTKTAHQIGVTIKNPKKRTRASRRAPTTVLTTDTTNFRQMVQEFTGIPTAPFTTSPFSRRLDLFNPNPLRPSANITTTITTSTVESGTTTTTSPGNYQFSPCNNMNNLQKQPSTFLDLQNPMFSFQSLLQNSLPIPNRSSTWGDQKDTFQAVNAIPNNTLNINGGSKFNSAIENHVLTAAAATADHLQPSTSTSTSTSWIN